MFCFKIAQNSTDSWDVWLNQNLDMLDEPVLIYNVAADVPFWFKSWGKHVPAGQGKEKLDGEILRGWPE